MLGSVLAAVAVAYAFIATTMFLFQERLVYFPLRELTATPADRGLDYEEIELLTEDGVKLHGWFVPAPAARAVLLYFHGNAGNISHRIERITLFHRLRLDVLIIDYRGYGRSQGRPSEQGTYRDAAAAWRHLTETRAIPPERIVLFGRSLGAAVAARLATEVAPGALVLEAGFTSLPELGQELYPWLPVKWLARLHYPVKDHLARVRCPVLVVHSRDDEIVPFHHGEALYAHALPPKQFLAITGGHNDSFLLAGRAYVDGLDAFLAKHFPAVP
jgi:fermentation-respiration switch protein FrsA (DUF1100 family)